jgi:excisionase family DNA binding protein
MAELKYLTLKEAAEILSISPRTLANFATSGQISAYRLPSACGKKARYRFKLSDIEEFMDGNKLLSVNIATKNVFKNNKARIDVEKIKNYLTCNSH